MRVTPSPARCEGLHGRLRRIEAGGKVVWRRSNCLRNPKTIKKAHGSLLVDKQLLIIHLMWFTHLGNAVLQLFFLKTALLQASQKLLTKVWREVCGHVTCRGTLVAFNLDLDTRVFSNEGVWRIIFKSTCSIELGQSTSSLDMLKRT